MPTRRPRHVVTETDHISVALDAAADRWPEDRGSRAKLLLHLIDVGYQSLRDADHQRRAARLETIQRTSGTLTGSYGQGYLDKLRADWPE